METKIKYLTAESLGPILETMFPTALIKPEGKWNNKKIDYLISVKLRDLHYDLITRLGNLDFDLFESRSHETSYEITNKDVNLLVEFDGSHHYIYPANITRDNKTYSFSLKWEEVDTLTYMLRIPYWIQLDGIMTKELFGLDIDFSNGYLQGFHSKKGILPANFCGSGEERFWKEISSLPQEVGKSVYDSLVEKIKDKGSGVVISRELLVRLNTKFGNQRLLKFLQENWGDKAYRHFDSISYIEIENSIECACLNQDETDSFYILTDEEKFEMLIDREPQRIKDFGLAKFEWKEIREFFNY